MKRSLVITLFSALVMFCGANTLNASGYKSADIAAQKFLFAMENKNVAVFWSLIPPQYKQELISEAGSEAAAKQKIKQEFLANVNPAELKQLLSNPEAKAAIIAKLKAVVIPVNGKYYIDFKKMGN